MPATTTAWGLPYPIASDAPAQLPATIGQLAERLDTISNGFD